MISTEGNEVNKGPAQISNNKESSFPLFPSVNPDSKRFLTEGNGVNKGLAQNPKQQRIFVPFVSFCEIPIQKDSIQKITKDRNDKELNQNEKTN
jgi:hypothetical protein